METNPVQDESALQSELTLARERLDELARELRTIDGEVDALAGERHQFGLLAQVCEGLEQLQELGSAALFWEDTSPALVDERLRHARGHVDRFEKQFDEIEARRQSVVEELERAQDHADIVEDDLLELKRREEEKKLEWIVEREVDSFPMQPAVMPWMRGGEDDQRFRKTLAIALLLSLLLGVIFPWIDLPLPDPWAQEEIPERLTRLIREEPPPPPPTPQPQQQSKPEESEPQLAKESTPEAKPKKAPDPAPASKGILAFREKFSSLAESKTPTRLGAQARIRKAGEAASGRIQRALVTAEGPGASGGIDIGKLSRNVGSGGDGIEGVEIARATSSIGAIGNGSDRPLSDGPGLSRTDEEIQIVFDRHKAALYRLYNRALRKDPTLRGQMVLRMTIEPDGSVSVCAVQSSDMDAPALSAQVVSRVKGFDFGAKEGIPAISILYPIDFLPAS